MNKFKIYEKFETTATLTWLLMDFAWMNKWEYLSTMFGALSAMMALFAFIMYDGGESNIRLLLAASFFWVMMNFCWVLEEFNDISWLMLMGNIYFVICLILSIFAFVKARQKNKPVDFKRLKID